jgi:hypothetical protein
MTWRSGRCPVGVKKSEPSAVIRAQNSSPVPVRMTTWFSRSSPIKADARLEAAYRVPSIGFSLKTDPLESSSCEFALMGDEVNGKYYEATKT